jgi:hypothetical protein
MSAQSVDVRGAECVSVPRGRVELTASVRKPFKMPPVGISVEVGGDGSANQFTLIDVSSAAIKQRRGQPNSAR